MGDGQASGSLPCRKGGNAADIWWDKHSATLGRLKNLTVFAIDPASVEAVAGLLQRGMRLTAMIQDRELQLMSDSDNIALTPTVRMAPD